MLRITTLPSSVSQGSSVETVVAGISVDVVGIFKITTVPVSKTEELSVVVEATV
jgi:hypothetical protein